MRLTLAALVVWLGATSVVHAQRRVIVLDDPGCRGRLQLPLDWVITPPDPCPGGTLSRLCGGAVAAGACPPVAEVAAALGDVGLDRCAADPALLPVAAALYEDPSAGAAALRVYRALGRAPSVRALALFRAGRIAARLSRYTEAAELFGEALDTQVHGPLRDSIVTQYAGVLVYDDHDEDQVPDSGFPDTWLRPPFLPDKPWARDVAVRAVGLFGDMTMYAEVERTADLIRRRWPSADTGDLAEPLAQAFERSDRYDQLIEHAFTEARRCLARRAGCETRWLDRAQSVAVARLGQCGRDVADGRDARRRLICLEGITIGERLSELRSSPTLALDTADAAAWVAADLARASARVASTSTDPAVRAQAATRLAASPPPPPPPLRTRAIPPAGPIVEGALDWDAVERAVPADALRACTPRTSTAVDVRLTIALDGTVSAAAATPAGRTADCVSRVLRGIRAPAAETAPVTVRGVIVLVPRAR